MVDATFGSVDSRTGAQEHVFATPAENGSLEA